MRGFWLILILASGFLWFGNPFAFAWISQVGLAIEQARGLVLPLLVLCLVVAVLLKRRSLILLSLIFIIKICTNLAYLFQPALSLTTANLKNLCTGDIPHATLITPSSEPHIKAEVWQNDAGILIGRICYTEKLTTPVFWELYRSLRRLASSVRHRTEEKIIITDLPLPEFARLYAILEEVSQTDRRGVQDFSFQSLYTGAPHVFTSALVNSQLEDLIELLSKK